MTNIEGKVALITGGSMGIGLGIARSMVEAGMKVAITSRSVKRAYDAVGSIGAEEAVLPLESDVKDLDSQERSVQEVLGKWGQLDVLVANAGVGHFSSIEDMTPEQWNNTIDTNLTGVFNSIKAGVNALKETKGYFITISSLAGTNFFAGGAAYNASKFGLTGFTQAVMLDLRKYGIKTTTIMPGSVATHFNHHMPGTADEWKIQIEDLGQLVVDLLKIDQRTLPSKVEVRPSTPPSK